MDCFVSIKENRDFRRIYGRGKSLVSPLVVIYLKKNRLKTCRVGITTSKKIGNAVMRNRSRRIIRAALREVLPKIEGSYDMIVVARSRTPFVKSTDVKKKIEMLFQKSGILKQEEKKEIENN